MFVNRPSQVTTLLVVFALCTAAGCARPQASTSARELEETSKDKPKPQHTKATKKVADSSNEFAQKLYGQLRKGAKAEENLVCSPLGVSNAVALAYAGSAKETEKQFAEALGFDAKPDEILSHFDQLAKVMSDAEKPIPFYRFGVRVKDTPATDKEGGVVVAEVFEKTPASRKGDAFRPGNVIRKIDDVSIKTVADFALALDQACKSVKVVVYDGEKKLATTLKVELADPPRIRPSSSGCQLNVANAVWTKQKGLQLEAPFLAALKQADVFQSSIDFSNRDAAAKKINDWVSGRTKELIPSLVRRDQIPTDAAFFFTNAVYFEGQWTFPFDPEATQEGKFSVAKDKTVAVPFMTQVGDFLYAKKDDYQLVELPYRGGNKSMVLLVPTKESKLGSLEDLYVDKGLEELREDAKSTAVRLSLPRFEASSRLDLKSALVKLGVSDAFTTKANFSRASKDKLALSNVVQQAKVQVDEKGTVAAAATAIEGAFAGGDRPIDFRLDRPFLFFIRDAKTKTVLFMGRISNPAKS